MWNYDTRIPLNIFHQPIPMQKCGELGMTSKEINFVQSHNLQGFDLDGFGHFIIDTVSGAIPTGDLSGVLKG